MCLLKTVGEAEATYPQSCPKPPFVCAYDAGSSAVVRWQHGITHAVRADCRRGVYHDLEL